MSKKTLIKVLSLAAGMYFLLEFMLPEKIGGEFDQFEVTSPAVARVDGDDYRVWYIGYYRRAESAVGLIEVSGTASTKRENPVMQRSLFNAFDQRGFVALAVTELPESSGYEMFYLGRSPALEYTLCRATSADGVSWDKAGAVDLLRAKPEAEPVALAGTVAAATATRGAAGLHVFVAHQGLDGTNSVLHGVVADGQRWVCAETPLALEGFDRAASVQTLASLPDEDGVLLWLRQSGGAARLYRVAADGATTFVGAAAFPEHAATFSIARGGDGYRAWLGMSRPLDSPPTPEASRTETWIAEAGSADGLSWTLATPANQPVADVGRRGQPTYLSRALPKAGTSLEIISAFALGLAVVNLVLLHSKRIVKRDGNVINSLAFFVAFVSMYCFVYYGQPENADPRWRAGFDFMFRHLQQAMAAAVFSMVAFYMVSAGYRSFRVRSAESAIMMGSAVIVMLGTVPLGKLMTMWAPTWLQLPTIADTLLDVVNSAAYRGIYFGIIVGGLVMAMRMLLGTEETMFRGVEKK